MLSILAINADRWNDGPPPFWPIFPVLWLVIIAAVVVTAITISRRNRFAAGVGAGEARLSERFASGEIDEDEFRSRRAILRERKQG